MSAANEILPTVFEIEGGIYITGQLTDEELHNALVKTSAKTLINVRASQEGSLLFSKHLAIIYSVGH